MPALSREDGMDGEEVSMFHEALNEQTIGELAAVMTHEPGEE